MAKLFCSNSSCAKATTYDAMKPKFCSHCGQPFDAAFKIQLAAPAIRQEAPRQIYQAPAQVQPPRYARPAPRQQYNEYGDPIEDESYVVPARFEVKASIIGQTKKMSFKDLAHMPIDSQGGDRMHGGHTDVNKILADARQSMSKQAMSDVDGE